MGGVVDVVSKGTGGFFGLDSVLDLGIGDTVKGALGDDGSRGFDVQEASPFSVDTGGFSGSFQGGQLTGQMSPELQRMYDQQLQQASMFGGLVPGAGRGLALAGNRALGQLGSFDPFAAAEEQFSRLDAILEPGRQQARAGTAAGLLSSGRLGSTAGARTQAEVEGEIERQRQSLLGEQFMGAQQTQQNLANMALGLTQGGTQQQAALQGLSQGALGGALSLDSQLQAALGLGSNVSKPAAVAQQEQGFGEQLVQGGITAGLGALIGLI